MRYNFHLIRKPTDIKASRDLQRNFQHPETDVERRTAAYITQYLQAKRIEWEDGVFAQKRRVAEAEESLAKRETKKALEDIRIGAKKAQEFLDRLADLRRTDHARRVPELRRQKLVILAQIGALNSLGEKIHRRDALWQAEYAGRPSGDLFQEIPDEQEQWKSTPLFQMTTEERLAADYRGTDLTIGPHP